MTYFDFRTTIDKISMQQEGLKIEIVLEMDRQVSEIGFSRPQINARNGLNVSYTRLFAIFEEFCWWNAAETESITKSTLA